APFSTYRRSMMMILLLFQVELGISISELLMLSSRTLRAFTFRLPSLRYSTVGVASLVRPNENLFLRPKQTPRSVYLLPTSRQLLFTGVTDGPPIKAKEDMINEKIMHKEIKADIVYEDGQCLAFRDVSPHAPTRNLPLFHLSEAC